MTTSRRRCVAAAALVAAASCSHSPARAPVAPGASTTTTTLAAASVPGPTATGNGRSTAPLPQAGKVDRRNPDAVAAAALTTLYSYDTAVDRGPADAARRAFQWLSPALAESIRTAQPGSPGATWTLWSAHRAVISAKIAPGHDDRPADTPTDAYRQYTVELVAHGRDKWQGPPEVTTVFLQLSWGTNGWSVEALTPR